ncbi:MAG: TRASH domain-containing protein [Candidatus Omnitrophica bacterium]|nr:TRASH domain-containing protein [Candidatus Omnitrophota bacterium]
MGDEAATVEYKGKTYNLCCAMCKKDFLKNPEAAIKKMEEQESQIK